MRKRGRPPSRPPEIVVEQAMRLFWRKGFLETTVDDLILSAAGSRFSLYNVYGGKRGLFASALDHYGRTVMTPLVAPLTRANAGLSEIGEFFAQFARPDGWLRDRPGCLVCLAAAEAAAYEPEQTQQVLGQIDGLRGLFVAALDRAQRNGELAPDREPEPAADYLVGVVIGLMTLARSPIATSTLLNFILGALDHVRGLRVEPTRSAR